MPRESERHPHPRTGRKSSAKPAAKPRKATSQQQSSAPRTSQSGRRKADQPIMVIPGLGKPSAAKKQQSVQGEVKAELIYQVEIPPALRRKLQRSNQSWLLLLFLAEL